MKKGIVWKISNWPIAIKIPLLVASFTIAFGALVTELVLFQISDIQEHSLENLSDAYLEGLSASVLPYVLRQDIWEVYDAVERSKTRYKNINITATIVTDDNNNIIAASNPTLFPTGTLILQEYLDLAYSTDAIEIRLDRPEIWVARDIVFQGNIIGKLIVSLDVSSQLVERKVFTQAMVGSNAVLTLIFAVFGYMLTRRMTRPMQVLSKHLELSTEGDLKQIPISEFEDTSKEVSAMFASYNSMVADVNERDQLANSLHREEKLAGLGRLAAAMAHEINNPLGGLLNGVDSLKRHGGNPDVRKKSIALLDRGLKSIGDVVQSSLLAYRTRSVKRNLCDKDFHDLRYLLRPEARRHSQKLNWDIKWSGKISLDGTSVRQVGLNLLLNASAAAGAGGTVAFYSSVENNTLKITVENDGEGIPTLLLDCLNNRENKGPPLDDGTKIGLWVTCRLVEEMKGCIRASSSELGSVVSVFIPFDKWVTKDAV